MQKSMKSVVRFRSQKHSAGFLKKSTTKQNPTLLFSKTGALVLWARIVVLIDSASTKKGASGRKSIPPARLLGNEQAFGMWLMSPGSPDYTK